MYIKISTILLAVTAAAITVSGGCSRSASETSAVENVESCDTLPDGVKKLVRAIADNDSVSFARMVTYPLQRPYPLHDIDDEEQMLSYYNAMVDDSLRNIVTHAYADRWSEYGWRGWSLDDGRYIWVDDAIYDVQYVSQKERKMIDSLTNEEIKSITPSIREGGWRPVMCMLNEQNGTVYRVDTSSKKLPNGVDAYRMAIYEMPSDLHGLPSKLLDGSAESEGSQGVAVYSFTDQNGNVIVLEPDSPETGKPMLINANDSAVQLKRAYWHELCSNSHAQSTK